ncbi:hypothetical protein JHK87_008508 [Glycine soja]|nr:hypothetical protein JHK87_008508 [Glycine soja]
MIDEIIRKEEKQSRLVYLYMICPIMQNWLMSNAFGRYQGDTSRERWRKLRNNCYKREEDIVKCAFQDIVSDEFNKMKHTDEMLWEYEGPPDTTYQGECQDILLEMQRIFYQDLNSQSPIQGKLLPHLILYLGANNSYLARAVCEHMQLNEDEAHGKEIWCPICKQGELKDNHNIIYCTCCELRLHKASKLTLDFLLDRLAKVHTEHFDKGCRLKPKFCMRTKFNLTALYISCEGCDTFEVVI